MSYMIQHFGLFRYKMYLFWTFFLASHVNGVAHIEPEDLNWPEFGGMSNRHSENTACGTRAPRVLSEEKA